MTSLLSALSAIRPRDGFYHKRYKVRAWWPLLLFSLQNSVLLCDQMFGDHEIVVKRTAQSLNTLAASRMRLKEVIRYYSWVAHEHVIDMAVVRSITRPLEYSR
jgi:hypothetical protein